MLFFCNLYGQGSPAVPLVPDKSWRGTSRMFLQNRWEPRSSSQLQAQKMLSEGRVQQIHTHALYCLQGFMDVSRHRYLFCDPHPAVFFFFFFLPLDTNRLRGESSFRPEPPQHRPKNLPTSTSNFTIAQR